MNLLERLEVIAADYYTKAMAIRTTIDILRKVENTDVAFDRPKKKKKGKRKHNAAARKAISIRMRKYWAERRAQGGNKSNKSGRKESGK